MKQKRVPEKISTEKQQKRRKLGEKENPTILIEILSDDESDDEIDPLLLDLTSDDEDSNIDSTHVTANSSISEKKTQFSRLARNNNLYELELFLSSNKELIFEIFVYFDGIRRPYGSSEHGFSTSDIFYFSLREGFSPEVIILLLKLIRQEIKEAAFTQRHAPELLKHFNFYSSILYLSTRPQNLKNLIGQILSLYIEIDDGRATYELLTDAIELNNSTFVDSFLKLALSKSKNPKCLPVENRDSLLLCVLDKFNCLDKASRTRAKLRTEAIIKTLRGRYPKPQYVKVNNPLLFALENNLPITMIKAFCIDGNLDSPNKEGYSPLMLAIKSRKIDVVRLLLKYGANPCLVFSINKHLLSAIEFAMEIHAAQSMINLINSFAKNFTNLRKEKTASSVSQLLQHSFFCNDQVKKRQNGKGQGDIVGIIELLIKDKYQEESDFNTCLLLISIKCWLIETIKLIEWVVKVGDNYDQALNIGLLICQQQAGKIINNPLFDSLPDLLQNQLQQQNLIISRLQKKIKSSNFVSANNCKLTYLVPCVEDLDAMHYFCAGSKDDQMSRLTKISKSLEEYAGIYPVYKTRSSMTDFYLDKLGWQVLFQAIRLHQPKMAKIAFDNIPNDNPLLIALLKVHDKKYILSLIDECASLKMGENKIIAQDVICGHLTFEILLNDLITTLELRRKINICFSLPTHHAFQDTPTGFCLINKVAVIMAYEALVSETHFTLLSLGLDVNRDNGLNAILMSKRFNQPSMHIDIYDRRVYPWDKPEDINNQLGLKGKRAGKTMVWQTKDKSYISIDLAKNYRNAPGDYHPAILLALTKLEEILKKAEKSQEKIIIFLPTGWDSHCEENAPCGREINGKNMLTSKESAKYRFTDEDLKYFNQKLMSLCLQDYQSSVLRIYWQLEGGYTDEVNNRQIQILTSVLHEQLSMLQSISDEPPSLHF